MIYSLSFLPEVEKDVLSGFDWYEDNSSGLEKTFYDCFTLMLMKFPEILYFFLLSIKILDAAFFAVSLMQFISEFKNKLLLCLDYFTVRGTRILLKAP